MLPYLDPPQLGPFNIFGLLVLLGVFFGSTAAFRHSERVGLDQGHAHRLAMVSGLAGVAGAHLVDVLLYQPGWMNKEDALWILINPLAGISSMGGVFGATIGFFLFAHATGIKKLKYADAASLGLLILLLFGRAGCASVHDHVGVATSFPLAVDFPAGNPASVVGPHHDLGLYEFVYLVFLLSGATILLWRPRRPGLLVGILAIGYSIPRFALEFLRRPSSDPRYLDLTPAQWATLSMLAAGIAVLVHIYRRRSEPPVNYLVATPWHRYAANALPFRSPAPGRSTHSSS